MSPLLSVKNLSITFTVHRLQLEVVKNISFDIPRRAICALVGESGSGKSVTAQAIMGILPNIARITGGGILLAPVSGDGKSVDIATLPQNGKQMRTIRGGRISMIFQEPMVSLSPLHTVGDQVSEALFLHRDIGRREGLELTAHMLGMVGFPEPQRALRTYSFELSGGLRQRAMIAMALVCQPSLLIADEPTTALDVTIQAQILKLIKDLQQELEMTVLIITHDLGVVANLADEVVVMYLGEVVERGGLRDIFTRPQHRYLQGLLRAAPRLDMKDGERLVPLREIAHHKSQLLQGARVERGQGSGDASDAKRTSNASDKKPAVDVQKTGQGDNKRTPHLVAEGLCRTFTIRKSGATGTASAMVRAVHDLSFTVYQGESFGLVGESGCGKTTLSKLLMRAITPEHGSIHYNDGHAMMDVLALEDAELFALRRKMQFIFQDPFSSLNPRMTVLDILREPLIIHRCGTVDEQVELVRELMRLVGLDVRFLNRYPHSFSGGQRQRIGIARALALRPDFLICDEPVSALDVSIQAQILNLLQDLQQELGLTYLFISHNLAVVNYLCERIAVMCAGQLVEIGPRESLFHNPQHPYTRALLASAPSADLQHPLDFGAAALGRTSQPAQWPPPFTIKDDCASVWVDIGDGHLVRAATGCTADDIVQ